MNTEAVYHIPPSYRDGFDIKTLRHGQNYADQGRVKQLEVLANPYDPSVFSILAKVQGSRVYELEVHVHGDEIDGVCSCPVGYNCKHVVAAVACYRSGSSPIVSASPPEAINLDESLDYNQEKWIKSLNLSKRTESKKGVIHYVLSIPPLSWWSRDCLLVSVYFLQELKHGGLGKPKPYTATTSSLRVKLDEIDYDVIGLLNLVCDSYNIRGGQHKIPARSQAVLMKKMLATGRCYWQKASGQPLQLSPVTKSAEFTWKMHSNGSQELVCVDSSGYLIENVIALDLLFAVDQDSGWVYELQLNISDMVVERLLQKPVVMPSQVRQFAAKLKELPAEAGIPIPTVFESVEQKKLAPNFVFNVSKCDDERGMRTHLDLCYGDQIVSTEKYNSTSFTCVVDNKLVQVIRDRELESDFVANITKNAKNRGVDFAAWLEDEGLLIENEYTDINDMIDVGERIVPQLKELGFPVNFDRTEFYNLQELDEWYTDLDTESEYDWFGLDLGVSVNGEKVSLLPHLVQAISDLEQVKDSEFYYLKLEAGRVLKLPIDRLRRMVDVITQFVDPNRLATTDNRFKISRYKASLLAEIEKAFSQTEMRWFGGEKLRQLGQRLSQFKKIKKASPPKKLLHAQLRSYQQDGLNWLQFLREYELGGVLADDMGLGKTIQALSHILIEKHTKRLDKPCLIIAPTSVIYNWQLEVERFTPSLSVLLLRGIDRHDKFSSIPEHDIVLTTYPLIVRDKEILLEHNYHLLILDEAQMIKNSQAKMTQVIQQLKAQYRLCLTGTPLENHLGELWSLFNFLMPGLLGSRGVFNREFQTPIEKSKDKDKLAQLIAITKPFLLRRTKAEVVKDLPEKTEIIKKVNLDSQQEDLYESIRLAMNKKVRQAIDEKGIERSQIVILDALLKLRQVCCDPQLVKLPEAKKVKHSAKLELLLSMLKELIPEGRRILLFSQFTSMLSLIEKQLDRVGIPYVKLTGSTTDRQKPIKRFQDGEVPLFLISLKSGGTGINLTAADTVIHYDPWWNPAVEAQATDRSHRIGQKNPVFVYKLIVENTVEEKIIDMQKKKRALMEALLSGQGSGAKLGKEDLEFLLS